MANSIVTVNAAVVLPPAPSLLQRTGALISQGGTNTTAQSLTLLTQLSDLTPYLAAAKTLSSLSWSGSIVSATTAAPHGWTNGDVVPATIAGAAPVGYNGSFNITVTGASTFTYPLASNPGTETVPGSVILADESELLSMATTFFAQGSATSVYVLELGEGTATEGVAALTTFITANSSPQVIYSYLVPREWDANSAFLTFLTNYTSPTAKVFFFVTTTTGTYSSYPSTLNDVFTLVQSPNAPITEFTCAAPFYVTLNYNPNGTNQVTPLSFAFLYGVTPYPIRGNSAVLAGFKTNNINFVDTGAEGDISNSILKWGNLMDGNPFNFWYSVDWFQVNAQLALANAVINGSNNPLAPLDYDQQGINVLQDVVTGVGKTGISYALAIGQLLQTQLVPTTFATNFENGDYIGNLVVNADPFTDYTTNNPSAYAAGTYGGLSMVVTPARGFISIIFNLTAVQL